MLEVLLHTIKDRVTSTIRRECGDTGKQRFNTSDVVQESLIQIWMSLSEQQIRELVECNSWLRKIALGHRAKLKRKHLAKKRSIYNEVAAEENLYGLDLSATDQLARVEQVDQVMKEVGQLKPVDKKIVVDHIFKDKAFLVIASELRRDAQFVRRRYRKAIQKLRSRLAARGIQIDE